MSNEVAERENTSGGAYRFPLQVYLIFANEICERFSYYGIHTILLMYLSSMYMLPKETSVSIYHGFNMLCYVSPILGAIISDGFWGRYKTILYISAVYTVGSLLLAITAIPSIIHSIGLYGPLVALSLIAIGTGGIKPCVSTFGADQLSPGNDRVVQNYFAVFYFSINMGSLVSMVVTPVLRSDVQCFREDCYFLAFGLPALLMILSVVLFVLGTRLYRCVEPNQNIIVIVFRTTLSALTRRLKSCIARENVRHSHWLEWARDTVEPQLLEDVKALYRVLLLFLPIPVFWTLFDQQGSRWTIQAMELSGNLGFLGVIKPDQMQALNPILVLLLIPLFSNVVYPACQRFGLLRRPLSRMCIGMLLAAFSFVVAGLLQMRMQQLSSFAHLPSAGCSHLRLVNAMPDTAVAVLSSQTIFPGSPALQPYEATQYHPLSIHSTESITLHLLMDVAYLDAKGYPHEIPVFPDTAEPPLESQSYTFILGLGPGSSNTTATTTTTRPNVTSKMMRDEYLPEYEVAKVRFISVNNLHHNHSHTTLEIAQKTIHLTAMEPSRYYRVPYGSHVILVDSVSSGVLSFGSGYIYTIVVSFSNDADTPKVHVFGDVEPRPLSLLWQIPQYVLLTSGEVLFSVTGLDFAYSSAPVSMKSCLAAAWLLTVSTGNFIVILFEGFKVTNDMATEFFIFSALLLLTTVIFTIMAYYYVPYNAPSPRVDESSMSITEDESQMLKPLLAPLSSNSYNPPASHPNDTDTATAPSHPNHL